MSATQEAASMKLTVISRNDFPEGIAHSPHAQAVVERWEADEKAAQEQGTAWSRWHMHTQEFEVEYLSEKVRRYVEIACGLISLRETHVQVPVGLLEVLEHRWTYFTDPEKAAVEEYRNRLT